MRYLCSECLLKLSSSSAECTLVTHAASPHTAQQTESDQQQMSQGLMPAHPQWDDTACIGQCTNIWSTGLKEPHRADIEGVRVRLARQIAGPVWAEAIVQIGDGLTQLPGTWPPGPVPAGSACTSKHSCTDSAAPRPEDALSSLSGALSGAKWLRMHLRDLHPVSMHAHACKPTCISTATDEQSSGQDTGIYWGNLSGFGDVYCLKPLVPAGAWPKSGPKMHVSVT